MIKHYYYAWNSDVIRGEKKKEKKITDSKQNPKTTKRNNFLDNSR